MIAATRGLMLSQDWRVNFQSHRPADGLVQLPPQLRNVNTQRREASVPLSSNSASGRPPELDMAREHLLSLERSHLCAVKIMAVYHSSSIGQKARRIFRSKGEYLFGREQTGHLQEMTSPAATAETLPVPPRVHLRVLPSNKTLHRTPT
jgi:hypothetical protein